MTKQTITVYDYFQGGSILHPIRADEKPKAYEVEAFCVGGVFAVFQDPRPGLKHCIAYAQGDDGHWWFAGTCDKAWIKEIINAFKAQLK